MWVPVPVCPPRARESTATVAPRFRRSLHVGSWERRWRMLEFDRLSKRYGATVALESLSFTVQPGQMFGFVGANGAGKTTAMRIALGVLGADAGEVRWMG